MIKDSIFRAYDIRGIYGVDIDENVAKHVGKALGTFLGGKGKSVAIGYDVRKSSPTLKKALVEGLTSSGVNVWDIGLVPTPTVYFAISHFGLDGGAIVSASHNPPEWNGFKLCKEKAMLCGWGMGLEKIKEIISSKAYIDGEAGNVLDKAEEVNNVYQKFLLERTNIRRRLKVLVDPGNGSCSQYADKILEKARLEVVAINNFPDGSFPARSPEPTDESLKEVKKMVVENGFDFAVAYDGDGDRAVFIDNHGRVIEGDKMLALLIRHFIHKADEKVVYEVSCSKLLDDIVKEKGIIPIISKVGHSFILEKMIIENAIFGGEIASHLYFRDVYGADDAIYATLKVAEMLSASHESLAEMVNNLPKYQTTRIVFSVPDEIKFFVIAKLNTKVIEKGFTPITLDGVRVNLDNGWFIVRASNTLPQIKATIEAKDSNSLSKLENEVISLVTESVKEVKGLDREAQVEFKRVSIT
ncbi:MAG: phosphomannomutase/phosphoglucomutase [Nitrososphaeria archaeon]|nr:phosphomannomutase/phosphoglucomutase [Nitrososphaeria archaeon]